MGKRVYANWGTKLIAAMADTASIAKVSIATAGELPALGAGDVLPLAIFSADRSQVEYLLATDIDAVTGDLTVTRAEEGSTAIGWASGSDIKCVNSAASMDEMLQRSGGNAMAGPLQMAGNEIQNPTEEIAPITSSAGAAVLDLSKSMSVIQLSEDTVFSFSNPPADTRLCYHTLEATQDSAGGWVMTPPAGVRNWSAISGQIDTTANTTTIIAFYTYDAGATSMALLVATGVA